MTKYTGQNLTQLATPHPSQAAMTTTSSLESLQTDEQRRVLDTVSQVRKCGLDSLLSLPQIVVCGDQSSGKSSLLEALTEIPFPRNDNLCTRFATEISLRREPESSLTVRIIPAETRSQEKKGRLRLFSEVITDFKDLPTVMDKAMHELGISEGSSAFAKDTLSVEIQGPDRPQLTLVDIPGLIQTSTRGVSEADVAMVAEITDSCIQQPRTICLAVVSATNDAANQPILSRVRKFDPHGERTLGVITKPDRLPSGSASEAKFLELARNEDVFFKLGWHVIKNRKFEESTFSIEERNLVEKTFFATSNFKALPRGDVGIDTLRVKLSSLLFEHVKKELPRLQDDLESALAVAQDALHHLGDSRATIEECRAFLTHFNMQCYRVCEAGLNGNYEHDYFKGANEEDDFSLHNKDTIARIRAAIQYANIKFADDFRLNAHKFRFRFDQHHPASKADPVATASSAEKSLPVDQNIPAAQVSPISPYSARSQDLEKRVVKPLPARKLLARSDRNLPTAQADLDAPSNLRPQDLAKSEAMEWVKRVLLRSRGTELVGNFNPHVVAELFWEQSERWDSIAREHVEHVSNLCRQFVSDLVREMAPADLQGRIQSSLVQDALRKRRESGLDELEKLLVDRKEFPINYNHYYTDNIHKKRQHKIKAEIEKHFRAVPHEAQVRYHEDDELDVPATFRGVLQKWADTVTPNMEDFSSEEALDCLLAIYKVQQKTFIANVTTQVIERHIARGLQDIFSPMVLVGMSDEKVLKLVSESSATNRQRTFLVDRIRKLEDGQDIFRGMMDS